MNIEQNGINETVKKKASLARTDNFLVIKNKPNIIIEINSQATINSSVLAFVQCNKYPSSAKVAVKG